MYVTPKVYGWLLPLTVAVSIVVLFLLGAVLADSPAVPQDTDCRIVTGVADNAKTLIYQHNNAVHEIRISSISAMLYTESETTIYFGAGTLRSGFTRQQFIDASNKFDEENKDKK